MRTTILMATVAFGLVAVALAPAGRRSQLAESSDAAPAVAQSESRGNAFAGNEYEAQRLAQSEFRAGERNAAA